VVPSVEDVASNLETIRDVTEYTIPENNNEEMAILFQAMQG